MGKGRSHIHYYIEKLEKGGYITPYESLEPWEPQQTFKPHKKLKGAIKLYQLTQAGSNFLAGIERLAVDRVFRLHNLYVKYPIRRQPGKKISWQRVEMTNWTQLLGRELGLKVRKNPRSVEIIASVIDGQDPYELLLRAREETDNLANHLEQKFDMELGRGKNSRKPHWGVYDRVAGKFSEHFQLSVDDIAKIDRSEGLGEIDFLNPEAAKEYLMLPANLRRVQSDLAVVKDSLHRVDSQLNRVADQLEKFTGEVHSLVEFLKGSAAEEPIQRPELLRRDRFVV